MPPVEKGAAAQMRKLLAHHEHIVDAIRTTLGLLNGHQTDAKQETAAAVFAKALQVDAARKAGRKTGRKVGRPKNAIHVKVLPAKPKRKQPTTAAGKAARRRAAAVMLSNFSTTEPRSAAGLGKKTRVGPFVLAGYLMPTGNGEYLRTDKPYQE